jgi:hypothetical protein
MAVVVTRHRYAQADEEIAEYFTTSVGVKAQSYEPSGGRTEEATENLPGQRRAGELARHDAIGRTLAACVHKATLRLVYEPHSWPVWIASSLSPRTGRGCFVRLACQGERARAAWGKAHPTAGSPDAGIVLAWVQALGAHRSTSTMLAAWVADCETERTQALAAYDLLRRDRVVVEGKATRLRRYERRQEAMGFVNGLLEWRERVRRERFDRRLGGA